MNSGSERSATERRRYAFGFSGYWKAELDVIGCRWSDLDPSLRWPGESALLSDRDTESGAFDDMILKYETLSGSLAGRPASGI